MIQLIMILIGLVGLYASYLHYRGHLNFEKRGVHRPGDGMIPVLDISVEVWANLQYARGRINRDQWLRATRRTA